MKLLGLTCAATIAAFSAGAQELTHAIDLLPGHPVHHESEGVAGVVMALSITPVEGQPAALKELCEELRVVAGLEPDIGEELSLNVIFIVPYKGMAVEGYYLPDDHTVGSGTLVKGETVARDRLDPIVARTGIPPGVLDETDVEHEISCETNAPVWSVRWEDFRRIGGEEPDTVIERARDRFMAIHQSVVEHNSKLLYVRNSRPDLLKASAAGG